jgi:hypothetical protein
MTIITGYDHDEVKNKAIFLLKINELQGCPEKFPFNLSFLKVVYPTFASPHEAGLPGWR